MPGLFDSALATHDPVAPPFPLVHGTKGLHLDRILASGALGTNKVCEVLNESLVFFFYGRADYSPPKGNNQQVELGAAPVFFFFDSGLIGTARFIYPFDTGATRENRYAPFITAPGTWQDYQLTCAADSPGRVVRRFYDGNDSYFKAKPDQGADLSAEPPPIRAYRDLIVDGAANADDRRSAIEVTLRPPVALNGNLKLALVPQGLYDDLRDKGALPTPPVEIATYDQGAQFSWDRLLKDEIRPQIREFLQDEGVL